MIGLLIVAHVIFLCAGAIVSSEPDQTRARTVLFFQAALGSIAAVTLVAAVRIAGKKWLIRELRLGQIESTSRTVAERRTAILKVMLAFVAGVGVGYSLLFDSDTILPLGLAVGPVVGWLVWFCPPRISLYPGRRDER
jgi:hypothetical protein